LRQANAWNTLFGRAVEMNALAQGVHVDSLGGRGITPTFNWEADTQPLNYLRPIEMFVADA